MAAAHAGWAIDCPASRIHECCLIVALSLKLSGLTPPRVPRPAAAIFTLTPAPLISIQIFISTQPPPPLYLEVMSTPTPRRLRVGTATSSSRFFHRARDAFKKDMTCNTTCYKRDTCNRKWHRVAIFG
eukprot:4603471-Pleurochrysis_carterae.AAC.1